MTISPPSPSQSTSTSLDNPSIQLHGAYTAQLTHTTTPTLTSHPTSVLIRIAYTGVCGSDVHFWTAGGINGRNATPQNPLTMGHEASGNVTAIGTAVHTLAPGDRVAIEPGFPCRVCADCKSGAYNLCPDMRFAAVPAIAAGGALAPKDAQHGTLCRTFRVPADCCYVLPAHVGMDEGVLVEPLAVAVHSARNVGVRPGDRVVVFGAGTVGLLCAAVARCFGASEVVCVDLNAARLEFAAEFASAGVWAPAMGSAEGAVAAKVNAEGIIERFGLGRGADVVFEASGAEASVQTGVYVLRPGGRYVQTGLGRPMMQFPLVEMSEKELHMHGCFRYGAGDFNLAVDLLRTGKVDVKRLITKVVPFERATEAWECTRKGEGIKTLIRGVED